MEPKQSINFADTAFRATVVGLAVIMVAGIIYAINPNIAKQTVATTPPAAAPAPVAAPQVAPLSTTEGRLQQLERVSTELIHQVTVLNALQYKREADSTKK